MQSHRRNNVVAFISPHISRILVYVGCLISAIASLVSASEPSIDFNRDVAPILSANCFQCHGPDGDQREADLRFDQQQDAFEELEDGGHAIVVGKPSQSRLVIRIKSDDPSLRMPPPESNRQLTSAQIETLETWIRQGANWGKHWAFEPLAPMSFPAVGDGTWQRSPIDAFILETLQQKGEHPAPEASRRKLIRRVYFDLLGLPPTVAEVQTFLADESPVAYEKVVDRLLASPQYGERWGRHWLDVARYGDSNGGDENHLYPHAFRYRNYVIDAWNRGLPYDAFLRQQLAGDLSQASTEAEQLESLAATGFLAIGMKILAEQDPVKKQADIVDEQIDTFGKAILGLTLGCARCHDHKFDPVPTTDYYGLAGIFHSTDIVDQELETDAYREDLAAHETKIANFKQQQSQIENQLQDNTRLGEMISLQAEKFTRGNVAVVKEGYGAGIGIISDPGGQANFAEYDIDTAKAGEYVLQLRYAALDARPGKILLNGKLVDEQAFSEVTGGWNPEHQKWFTECRLRLQHGKNILRLESEPNMSHIDRLRLVSLDSSDALRELFTQLENVQQQISEVAQPTAPMAMAVKDGEVKNTRVHVRGSHLSLGDEVPRRFVSIVTESNSPMPSATQSGRRELVDWLTKPESPASALTSRVIVNRLWQWHFGSGIVSTPNNFGLQGERPSHPGLLDWLAATLIRNAWSIKALQREIVLSSTYRVASTSSAKPGATYANWHPKRIEAEVFRDAVLFHAGNLEFQSGGAPPNVKSGDPSPEDLRRNRETYEASRRRSAYLTIVRSNVYKLFTLLDFPDSATPVGKRAKTIVPTQSLLLMNSPFVMRQSEQVAKQILQTKSEQDLERAQVRELYKRLFARLPTDDEIAWVDELIAEYKDTGASTQQAWTAVCQVLLTSHEFFYID